MKASVFRPLSFIVCLLIFITMFPIIVGAQDVSNDFEFINNVELLDINGNPLGSDVSINDSCKLKYYYSIPNDAEVFDGDTMTLDVPKQFLVLKNDTFTLKTDSGDIIANGEITTNNKINITFTSYASTASNISGYFWFSLTFNESEIQNVNEEYIVFNLNATAPVTIIVDFEDTDNSDMSIQKNVTYNESTQIAEWTVVMNNENLPCDSLVFSDNLPDDVEYVDNSFTVNGERKTPVITGDTLSYDFGAVSTKQTVKFKTYVPDASIVAYGLNTVSINNTAKMRIDDKTEKTSTATLKITVNPLKKSGTLFYSEKKITWTINVNSKNFEIKNAVIRDVIPDGLTLDASSIKLNGVTLPSSKYSISGQELTINLGDISTKQVITFDTKINDEYYSTSASSITFKNYVYLLTAELSKEVEARGNIYFSNYFISKAVVSQNNSTGIAKFSIKINANKHTLDNVVVSDDLAIGCNYVPGSATIDNGASQSGFEYTPASAGDTTKTGTLKYTFPDTIDDTYIITFECKINEDFGYGTNFSSKNLYNTALIYTNGSFLDSSETHATFSGSVLYKYYSSFDPDTKDITWKIKINETKYSLNKVELKDILPDGTEYVPGSFYFENNANSSFDPDLNGLSYNSATNTLTYTFPTDYNVTTELKVGLKTKIVDSPILSQSGQYRFTNEAQLTHDKIDSAIISRAGKNLTSTMLTKDAAYTKGNDYIDWTVETNHLETSLVNAKISDTLQEGLSLDTYSVELWKASVSDGKLTSTTKVSLDQSNIAYDDTTREFILTLPDTLTDSAYILKFRTYITDASKQPFQNSASLSGSTKVETITSTIVQTIVQSSGSSGSGETGDITVTKVDSSDSNKKLSGATLQLLDKYGNTVSEKITDNEGKAQFEQLRFDVDYTLIETDAPDGYILNNQPYTFQIPGSSEDKSLTYTLKNDPKLGSIKLIKATEDEEPLEGATFTLFDETGTNIIKTATSTSTGLVEFNDVPLGKYIIKETIAPKGYELSTQVIIAELTQPMQVLDLGMFTNKLQIGSIKLIKTDQVGKALAGATFTLYDSEGTVAIASAVSQSDGSVLFSNIPLGDYIIRETKAPAGYLINKTDLTVTIMENNEVVDVGKIENKLQLFDITLLKTDEDNNPLAGCEFTLYDEYFVELDKTLSDDDGVVTFSDLPIGDYIIRETKTLDGYFRYNKNIYVTITGDKQVVQTDPVINKEDDGGDVPEGYVRDDDIEIKVLSESFTNDPGSTPKTGLTPIDYLKLALLAGFLIGTTIYLDKKLVRDKQKKLN